MSRYTIPDSDDDSCDSFMTTLTSKESQGQAPGAGGTIDISERQNACNVQAKSCLNDIPRPIILNSESAAPAAHDEITVAVEGGVDSYRRRRKLRNQTGGPEARGPMKRKSAGSSTRSAKGVNIGYQQNRDGKRRRTSGGFAPANPPTSNGPVIEHTPSQPNPGGPQPLRHNVDPLPGSRPTSILVGHWAKSNSPDPRDRHAVYGILGKNDIFRVKLVRETRDRRFFEGNFPAGAGALWIAYEEVAFEPHLKNLARNVIKEYCRVRQYQIDMGEKDGERTSNETKAVYEAQARAAGTNYKAPAPLSIAPPLPRLPADYGEEPDQTGRMRYFRHELRRSRRVEAAKAEARQSYIDIDTTPPQPAAAPRQSTGRTSLNNNAIERTSALAEREIARIELAQERAHMQAANRKRAAAAAAQAAQAAGANIPGLAVDGRQQLHERDEIQRLNEVWARQESLRLGTNAEDAKMYAGVKYERKTQGPFPGRLISQGTTINIDGEEYILYRVLVKP